MSNVGKYQIKESQRKIMWKRFEKNALETDIFLRAFYRRVNELVLSLKKRWRRIKWN